MLNLPQPYDYQTSNGSFDHVAPYHTDPTPLLERLGIELPFTVIDKTDGISTCSRCKQTYAGYQDTCQRQIPYFKFRYLDFTNCGLPVREGNHFKGEVFQYIGDLVECVDGNLYGSCGAYCRWSLSAEYNHQSEFFQSLHSLEDGPIRSLQPILPYVTNPTELDRMEKDAIHRRTDLLLMKTDQLASAVRMIADKMQMAGDSLRF